MILDKKRTEIKVKAPKNRVEIICNEYRNYPGLRLMPCSLQM